MKTFKQFILETFIDNVKDEEARKKIKELMLKSPLDAYKLFHSSEHGYKKAKWSPVNPKTQPEKWKKTAK